MSLAKDIITRSIIPTTVCHDVTGRSYDKVVRWLRPADFYRAQERREREAYDKAATASGRSDTHTYQDFLDAN